MAVFHLLLAVVGFPVVLIFVYFNSRNIRKRGIRVYPGLIAALVSVSSVLLSRYWPPLDLFWKQIIFPDSNIHFLIPLLPILLYLVFRASIIFTKTYKIGGRTEIEKEPIWSKAILSLSILATMAYSLISAFSLYYLLWMT